MWAPHAIAVGVVSDLGCEHRIAVDDGRENLVRVVGSTAVDDELMNVVLGLISASEAPQRLRDWMLTIGNSKKLLPLAAQRLVEDAVLSMNLERALLVLLGCFASSSARMLSPSDGNGSNR